MTCFLIALRQALRRAFRLPTTPVPIGRLSLAFGIVASMIASAFGPLISVGVAQQTTPTTRLQVVIKDVVIHDDREGQFSDKGELTATADAKGTVAEANEENNDRKITARCGEAN